MLSILLLACQSNNQKNSIDPDKPFSFQPPETGKAAIYGFLFQSETGKPVTGAPFLAKALNSENPDTPIAISFSLQNDPGADYDNDSGFFIFKNIEPQDNYVIIIVNGPGDFTIIQEPESDLPMIFKVGSDEALDLGILYNGEGRNG